MPTTLSFAGSLRRPVNLLLVALLAVVGFVAMSGGTSSGGAQAHASSLTFRQKAVQIASFQKGDPYRYGADGPNAFDCSGLTKYAYKQTGHYLQHSTSGQWRETMRIRKHHKRPGDLIFYTSNGRPSGIYHVALYAGNGYTWVARHSGTRVTKQKIYSSRYLVGRVRR
ncbi:MAG TPA: NlpC/P60 family protein [Mycobacteriales bacterium]|nr:NlpC/P60 family protein [Mycobacteriales bacterium]